jgi:hypothetical protein
METINRFLIEAIKRFSAETPWFFKVIRNISIISTLVTGLPDLLSFLTASWVELPQFVFVFANKTISISSVVAAVIAQLTVTAAEKKELGITDKVYNKG